ncbi:TIM barrel protein [Anaerotalea alkaliphila]|uniref:TIM barrel protein n=1 Tax=Anaerotalea alkaliphila TaxID=2662126 RepID=A0A7X5HXQ3_9FIRM|nr:TIM barrel protein [Anaerotalea alkaliphila]NDL68560.1 TIM barrel protein [Anaerotalea alkaliphila]
MKTTACIETLFTEYPWEKRFEEAKKAGFDYVEFWSWEDKDLDQIKKLAEEAGIGISGFNGDADYSLVDPSHKAPYLEFLRRSLEAAKKIGALSVTIHSNALGDAGKVVERYEDLSDTVKICSMYDTLKESARLAEEYGIACNLEALNITTDHVGNYLKHTQMAAEMIRLIGSPKLKILYDVYHMQLNEGSICDTLTKYIDTIGHIHIADAPGRHEPGTGEVNYPFVIKHLRNLNYTDRVGCELFPKSGTEDAVKAIMGIFA